MNASSTSQAANWCMDTGKPSAINSLTVLSLYWNDGPKSQSDDLAQVAEILLNQWLIQVVFDVQVRFDSQVEGFFHCRTARPAQHSNHEKKRCVIKTRMRGDQAQETAG